MSTTSRLAICLLFFFCFSSTFAAQLSPVITATAAGEKVRFSSPGEAAQIRVQILSGTGAELFDSAWRDGNVLDWPIESLADGAYRCIVMVKNLDGEVSQKDAALSVHDGRLAIDPAMENDAPRVTLLVHDQKDGAIVTTNGDLSFRFGNFLAGKDAEKMRLTASGDLFVEGRLHITQGLVFPDGTIQMTAEGAQESNGVIRQRPSASNGLSRPNRLKPRPDASDAQFNVDSLGVHIGTTSAFGLDVAGNVTLFSNLALPSTTSGGTAGVISLGGGRFAHSYGGYNTFVGLNSGNFTLTGSENMGIGVNALESITTGAFNTASGNDALWLNTGGNGNTAMGFFALANSTGSGNIGIGNGAGTSITSGNNNIFIGNAGVAADSGRIRIGTSGTHTGVFLPGTLDVENNLALPSTSASAGAITIGGTRYAHSFGTNNTFVGGNAGNTTMTGTNNVAAGESALLANTSGSNNTGLGRFALKYVTSGGNNIAVGQNAGNNITTGSNNIDIGNIGCYASYCENPEANTIRIGTFGVQNRAFVAGIYQVATGPSQFAVYVDSEGQLGTLASSATVKRDIAAIGDASSNLLKLRPVSFFYRNDTIGIRQYGLIAEEVAEVMPELVQFSSSGDAQTVRYHFLPPLLLNEVQKQELRIAAMDQTIREQREQIAMLAARLSTLEGQQKARQ